MYQTFSVIRYKYFCLQIVLKTEERTEKSTDMEKKEYLETISNEILEFHRKGSYDVTYMKTNGLALRENHGIQTTGIKGSEGYKIADQRQVLKILENYITELYDQGLKKKKKLGHTWKKSLWILKREKELGMQLGCTE